MTLSPYLVLLHAVEIDDDNDTIIIDEAGVDRTATIAHGTYWANGELGATDLLKAVADALSAADSGGNTYNLSWENASIELSVDTDPANPAATCRVTRDSGSMAFRVKWNDAATTFDAALLGFAVTKVAADANDEFSTLSPSCMWVGNEVVRIMQPRIIAAGAEETEGADGSLDVVARASHSERRRIDLRLVDARRLWVHANTSDPAATLARFWDTARDGRALEVHTLEMISGTTRLYAMALDDTDVTWDGIAYSKWLFCQPTIAGIEPSPVIDGMDSWDLELHIAGYIEP